MTARSARVLVAEDHPVFRRGLADALRGAGFTVVAEVADGAAALDGIRAHAPEIAVLDIEMPGTSGFDAARALAEDAGRPALVFLTMHKDGAMLRRALELGARGYVLKDAAVSEIVACLDTVAAGRVYVSGAVDAPRSDAASRLTPAERRVLELIAEDRTTADVAAALGISPKTVENHRANICRKLGLQGPQALLRYALAQRRPMERDRGA